MATYKRFTKIVFLILNLVTVVMYLLSCLAPYLDPARWWMISFLGLGFVFLLVTLIAFIFFWLVFKPKYIFISLIAIFFGWKSIAASFGFHLPRKFDYAKEKGSLRIV